MPNLILLFYPTESQHEVAGHQPKDFCQVSCELMSYVCLFETQLDQCLSNAVDNCYSYVYVLFFDDSLCWSYNLNLWTWWWHVIHLSIFSGEDEEEVVYQDSQVTQEMLEEQLVRLLTREVLDLLSKYLHPPLPFSNHHL